MMSKRVKQGPSSGVTPLVKRPIPDRHKMPDERNGMTHKFRIGDDTDGVKGYITANCWEDGAVGEIFVKMDKQGSAMSGFVDAWAISVSMLLQVGVPLKTIIGKFRGQRFQPGGYTKNSDIRIATSPIDYIVRWLELRFLPPEKDDTP
jgi:ribonucleoside-diphosphate reductase alpha chain